MARFFPRDVIHWGEERLHPLRAFAVRSVEPAGITGLVLRSYRALVLSATMSSGWIAFVLGLTVGVLFLCGMLTWHLGNYPIKRWPLRALAFAIIEVIAELGMSSLLIGFGRERFGSRVASWGDWWPMAGQTLIERLLVVALFTMVLAASVQLVRRTLDKRETDIA
jgi:hypothetical protein